VVAIGDSVTQTGLTDCLATKLVIMSTKTVWYARIYVTEDDQKLASGQEQTLR
jgi:hypothetical protein